ncbi:secreted frizzled-related protein 5-like isoform X2 [Acanthaster planci]|uniref:Secreted frizzled-related protein 1 n=1 Tax=Acanthaster planci TaxID=133434 RepID=A0A8B7YYY0_ACAPL|nr:secreted frizzled-related protein 5-like isoform X2 [Acanthaster planci]
MLGFVTVVFAACLARMTAGYAMDLSGRITKPTCVDIPSDLTLCQNIGYNRMRMPNLLDHDSIFEVKDQSQGWIPLLIVNCDNDTQLFLCSLFSPVCLDRPIYPCRSLCQKVRQNCEPIMVRNCFPWPAMLECDLFPEDNGLCIQSEMRQKNTTDQPTQSSLIPSGMSGMVAAVGSLFTQCHDDADAASIVEYFCNADFVLKMRLKEVKETSDGKKYVGDTNEGKYLVIKQGSLKQKDLNKMRFLTREGANCGCDMLQPGRENFLVMGHRDGKKLYMTYVHIWTKSREFRNATRQFGQPCPGEAVESSEPPATVAGGGKKPKKDRGGKRGRPGRRERPDRDGGPAETTTKAATERKLTREERRQQRREEKREERRNNRE